MGKLLRLVVILFCSQLALAQAIKIGTLEVTNLYFNGTFLEQDYILSLDTRNVISGPMSFGNAVLTINGQSIQTGPFTCVLNGQNLCGWLFPGGPANLGYDVPVCQSGCLALTVQLFTANGTPLVLTQANGQPFTEWAIDSNTMGVLPGQTTLKQYQRMTVVLHPDPKAK